MTEIELLNAKLVAASADLVETRAQTNRIRTEAQRDIDHITECLNLVLTDRSVDAHEYISFVLDDLRYLRWSLDKLPHN